MGKSYFSRQLLLVANQLAIIFYLCAMIALGYEIQAESYIHLIFIFFIFGDAAYLSYKNIQNSSILNRFTFLLLLSGWQFLLSLFDANSASGTLATALLPLNLYQVVYFIQLFVFQALAYRHQKNLLWLLRIAGGLSTVCYFTSPVAFAFSFMGQFILSVAILLFIMAIHYKQIFFFMKSQKKELLLSSFFVALPVLCYIAVFHNRPAYLNNLGSYFVLMLTFVSIHNIVFQCHPAQEKFYALSKRSTAILIAAGAVPIVLQVVVFRFTFAILLVSGYIAIFLAMAFNILLYRQICRLPQSFDNPADRPHFYAYSLAQIKREEALKKDFSNYLHDDILQDLLSIKNMIRKAEQPEVQQILLDTLGELNTSIRLQMQTYHPNMVKSLTLKENIQNLLDTLGEHQSAKIILDCDDNIFLIDPYPILIYRMIKELVRNALKHAAATKVCVLLTQENGYISLKVTDNGIGYKPFTHQTTQRHGLASIQEQVSLLNGTLDIKAAALGGTEILVAMPMNGDNTYENFIS